MPELSHNQCLHPEAWAEIKAELKAIQHSLNNTKVMLTDIHDRMFVDNGVACHQTRLQSIETRLDAHDAAIEKIEPLPSKVQNTESKVNGMMWTILAVAGAVIVELVHTVFTIFGKK